MHLLVRAWTGSAAAGLVAGIVYGLHPAKISDVAHPYVTDTAWTVLAMYFATRFFDRGRWRDALGLGACGALQIGSGFYPLLGALCLAPPFAIWLLRRFGIRQLRPGPALLALALPVLATAWIYTPYVQRSAAGATARTWIGSRRRASSSHTPSIPEARPDPRT